MSNKMRELPRLTGKNKRFFESLMQARELVAGQIQFHAAEALDSNNSDKRGITTHMADLGSDNSRHEMELQLMTEEGNVLELIEDAVQRLLDGEFGKCQDCGDKIPEARLEVKPYACLCIKCKSIREKNNGQNPYVD